MRGVVGKHYFIFKGIIEPTFAVRPQINETEEKNSQNQGKCSQRV